jgi:1,2-phenylacetyl-CoA epoxidase catalytic subunit
MRCLDRRFTAWTDFIAANLLVDTALTVLLTAATESPYEPLRQRARKIQQEEAAHWVHAVGWLRRLGTACAPSLAAIWDDAFTWFGRADDPVVGPLAAAHLLDADADGLRHRLRARLAPVLDEANLAELLLARELPWPHWDADTRRLLSD